MPWPEAVVRVDEDLARRLLADQHPDLADRPIRLVDAGFDNDVLRLGPDLAMRMPRRLAAATLIEHEQQWMPRLPTDLNLEVPAPRRLGVPGEGYPWHWSVVPWIEGDPADRQPPRDARRTAQAVGEFLQRLHVAAPPGLPVNPFRSGPLSSRVDTFHDRLRALESHVDRAGALAIWTHAHEAEVYGGPPRWLHGDLHPANLLVRDGVVAAVIDFGDTCAGDPACDLGAAYLTVPPGHRPSLHERYETDEQTKRRATGWALLFALMLLEIGLSQRPSYAEVARTALGWLGLSPPRWSG